MITGIGYTILAAQDLPMHLWQCKMQNAGTEEWEAGILGVKLPRLVLGNRDTRHLGLDMSLSFLVLQCFSVQVKVYKT